MADLEPYQKRVLACVLSEKAAVSFVGRFSELDRELGEGFFSSRCRAVYKVVSNYYKLCYSRISRDEFVEALDSAKIDPTVIVEYVSLFEEIESGEPVSEGNFRFAVAVLKERTYEDRLFGVLEETIKILGGSRKSVGDAKVAGYASARAYLSMKIADLDSQDQEVVLDGNVVEEAGELMEEYVLIKNSPIRGGVSTGFREIDEITGGFRPGDLVLVAGYSGDGKSMSCINVAHNLVFNQGKNVVYATGETLRSQVRRRLISLRSRNPQFGYPEGLKSSVMKIGGFNEEQESVYRAVLEDLGSSKYGNFVILQFPRNATVEFLANQLIRYSSKFDVDCFIIDELRLLSSPRRRQSRWEELDDIILSVKNLGVSYNKGKGIVVVSPYQVRREDWKKAVTEGKSYNRSCLANCSESERSADFIWSVFDMPLENGGNPSELKCAILKNRDGEVIPEFYLQKDFSTCYVGSRSTPSLDIDDFGDLI